MTTSYVKQTIENLLSQYGGSNMNNSTKTALVVGGGTGIGLGIASVLAKNGYRVAIAGRREKVLVFIAGRHVKQLN